LKRISMSQSFYYKLKPEWVLRGWDNLAHALVNTETGQMAVLDEAAFLAASASDGETDLELPVFLDRHRQIRDSLFASGIVEKLEHSLPVQDFQRYRKAPNPYYKTLHWSITGSCNLKCRHCYLSAPDKKYGDMTFAEITRMIDEMVEAGIMEVSITGGEPFVRKEIWDILALLREKRIRISQIYTNGVLVSDAVLERLKEVLGPQAENGTQTEFSLSFDGVGTHDDLRGIEGTEEKTIRAIERIGAHGFPVRIETALYRKNAGRLADTLHLLAAKGVASWKISGIGDVGSWLETGGAENLTIGETYDCYLDLLKNYLRAGRPLNIQMGGFYMGRKDTGEDGAFYGHSAGKRDEGFLKRYSCNACRYIRYLLSDGTLLPCISMTGTEIQKQMPNVRDKGLSEALKDPNLWEIVSVKVGNLVDKNKECAACEHLGNCNLGCRSCALTYNGGIFSKDPFTCYYWKNGYPEKIMQVKELVK
jgi:radical SAM protein with 4Fe4S-binding SPASM domain